VSGYTGPERRLSKNRRFRSMIQGCLEVNRKEFPEDIEKMFRTIHPDNLGELPAWVYAELLAHWKSKYAELKAKYLELSGRQEWQP